MPIRYEILQERNNDINDHVVVIVLLILLLLSLLISAQYYLLLKHVDLVDLPERRAYDIHKDP